MKVIGWALVTVDVAFALLMGVCLILGLGGPSVIAANLCIGAVSAVAVGFNMSEW